MFRKYCADSIIKQRSNITFRYTQQLNKNKYQDDVVYFWDKYVFITFMEI